LLLERETKGELSFWFKLTKMAASTIFNSLYLHIDEIYMFIFRKTSDKKIDIKKSEEADPLLLEHD